MDLPREVASLIPEARLVEMPGDGPPCVLGRHRSLPDEIEEFLTGARTGADPDRVLTTMLFTDIVDSTTRAAELGDRRWRDSSIGTTSSCAPRSSGSGGGRSPPPATASSPRSTVPPGPCGAPAAIMAAVSALGVQIRAGVHTGEVEVRGDDLGGLAVHIGARVAALAGAGEVLVSSTVKDLLAGSGIDFEDSRRARAEGRPRHVASVPSRRPTEPEDAGAFCGGCDG